MILVTTAERRSGAAADQTMEDLWFGYQLSGHFWSVFIRRAVRLLEKKNTSFSSSCDNVLLCLNLIQG